MYLALKTVAVLARVELVCGICDHKEYTSPQRFENLPIGNLSTIDALRHDITINNGWAQNGRGNYVCPACVERANNRRR